ncbi:MAG: hypothetical protein KIS76_03940 [Pyrinomonadaceae bacterium]|nr:hypothetical protein [Pyrinomonadaceae bacterium]
MKSVEENIKIIAEQIAEMNRMQIKSETVWEERFAEMRAQHRRAEALLTRRFDHLAQLTGIVFDRMDDFGTDLETASKKMKRK